MKTRFSWRILGSAAVMLVATLFFLGAGRGTPPTVYTPGEGERILSRVQIIQLDDTVGRFDTATGALHRFHGDLHKPNVRGQWVLHTRGVTDRTSGMLELQRARGVRGEDALFLVDIVTGDTWVLRRRGSGADWDRVDIVR